MSVKTKTNLDNIEECAKKIDEQAQIGLLRLRDITPNEYNKMLKKIKSLAKEILNEIENLS